MGKRACFSVNFWKNGASFLGILEKGKPVDSFGTLLTTFTGSMENLNSAYEARLVRISESFSCSSSPGRSNRKPGIMLCTPRHRTPAIYYTLHDTVTVACEHERRHFASPRRKIRIFVSASANPQNPDKWGMSALYEMRPFMRPYLDLGRDRRVV